MLRVGLYLMALIAGGASLLFIEVNTTPFTLITGAMIGIAAPLLDGISSNAGNIKLSWYCIQYRRKIVRFSVSYLFRIKVDNHYLLIRGTRWPQFQPVGGVYKYTDGAKAFLDEIGARPDDLVQSDDASLNDLRIRVPGQKILTFVRWFESGRSRETSPWREFHEELISPGLLSFEDFPFIVEDFIRREIRPIRFSPYAKSWEILIADIYELIPTQEQLAALRRLKTAEHSNLLWASEEQITRLGATPGKDQEIQISPTAGWTL
jgi:hypothetical protein